MDIKKPIFIGSPAGAAARARETKTQQHTTKRGRKRAGIKSRVIAKTSCGENSYGKS
jgi:hypothetical protein